MASKKIADGSLGIVSSSGGAAALSAVKKVKAVATAVGVGGPPARTHGKVSFLRKTYQQARATITAAPALVIENFQGSKDAEDERSEEGSEVEELVDEPPSPASHSNSHEPLSPARRSNSKKASSKWQVAQSMVTGAGKALTYHNDMVQKIRLAAQAAFERSRLQNEMVEALSAALMTDVECAAPGVSDFIENILYDITDAKVKDRAEVAQRVLNLMMTPDQALALQRLRDCLIMQLEDDRSSGDELEKVYEKLKARVDTMREEFPVIATLQEVPAPERALSKRRCCLIEPTEPVQGDKVRTDPTKPSGPVSEARPSSGPKPEEAQPPAATQPTVQPSAQSTLVTAAPTPVVKGRSEMRKATLPREPPARSVVVEVDKTKKEQKQEAKIVANTLAQHTVDNAERFGSDDKHEVPNPNPTGKTNNDSTKTDDKSGGESARNLLKKKSSFKAAEEAVPVVRPPSASATAVPEPRPKAEAEPIRQEAAPPVQMSNPGFGGLDLPPVLDCKEEGAQEHFFEMIVVGRSPRSKPAAKCRQLRLRFPLLPMFNRTTQEEQKQSPKIDHRRSVSRAAAELFPSTRAHAATSQGFMPVLPKSPGAGQLPVLPKAPDASQLASQSMRGFGRLGPAPSLCVGNDDHAHTWNGRSFL